MNPAPPLKSPAYPSQSSTAVHRAKKLLATLPHLTDGDVAKICKIDLADVQIAREANSQ